ncbi:MAG: LysR family transcriptional regulator [Firmicutes bacterium]|nr:LysR family transcriptional regulator [Bacillota bacterium]
MAHVAGVKVKDSRCLPSAGLLVRSGGAGQLGAQMADAIERLTLHQLRVFVCVVESGGITHAAERLHVTQSTVSTQLARIRRILGVPLFRRAGQRLALTAAGQILYDRGQAICRQQERLGSDLEALLSGAGGRLALGVSQTGAMYAVLEAVRRGRETVPALRLDVTVSYARNLFTYLLDGRLDVVVEWGGGPTPPVLPQRALRTYPFYLLAAPWYPLPRPLTPEAFLQQSFVTMQYGPEEIGVVEWEVVRRNLRPAHVVRLPSIDAVKRWTAVGLGVTILSPLSVQDELADHRLAIWPFSPLDFQRPLTLFWKPGTPEVLLNTFAELMTTVLDETVRTPAGEGGGRTGASPSD